MIFAISLECAHFGHISMIWNFLSMSCKLCWIWYGIPKQITTKYGEQSIQSGDHSKGFVYSIYKILQGYPDRPVYVNSNLNEHLTCYYMQITLRDISTETRELSYCQLCRHWWHRWLPLWQSRGRQWRQSWHGKPRCYDKVGIIKKSRVSLHHYCYPCLSLFLTINLVS